LKGVLPQQKFLKKLTLGTVGKTFFTFAKTVSQAKRNRVNTTVAGQVREQPSKKLCELRLRSRKAFEPHPYYTSVEACSCESRLLLIDLYVFEKERTTVYRVCYATQLKCVYFTHLTTCYARF